MSESVVIMDDRLLTTTSSSKTSLVFVEVVLKWSFVYMEK